MLKINWWQGLLIIIGALLIGSALVFFLGSWFLGGLLGKIINFMLEAIAR